MHGLQAFLFKYITVKMLLKGEVEIVMEITLLIIENDGKVMILCFWISVGTLKQKYVLVKC